MNGVATDEEIRVWWAHIECDAPYLGVNHAWLQLIPRTAPENAGVVQHVRVPSVEEALGEETLDAAASRLSGAFALYNRSDARLFRAACEERQVSAADLRLGLLAVGICRALESSASQQKVRLGRKWIRGGEPIVPVRDLCGAEFHRWLAQRAKRYALEDLRGEGGNRREVPVSSLENRRSGVSSDDYLSTLNLNASDDFDYEEDAWPQQKSALADLGTLLDVATPNQRERLTSALQVARDSADIPSIRAIADRLEESPAALRKDLQRLREKAPNVATRRRRQTKE